MVQKIGTRLFVSRLSSYTTRESLKNLFSQFGIVTEATLVKDPKTERPKGFAFVSFNSEMEAEKAMKGLNGRIIDERLIFVEPAKAEKPKDAL